MMENHLDSVDIKEEDIYHIIKNLIPNKAHGWDDLSEWISSVLNLLRFLRSCCFSHHWRKVFSQLIRAKEI